MNYFRLLLCSLFLAATVSAAPFDTADAVAAHAPGSVFTQGEPLRFSLKPYAASPLKWTLRDWRNRELRSGDWPGAGKAELTLAALPDGYYILTVESPEAAFDGFRSFAVVPDPATRRRNPDTFFAMDSAQSWLARPDSANVRHPGDAYELVSEVIRRGGIDVVRERMSWAECEAVPGKFDWKQYKLNADLLSRRGVGISGMYHNAPRWAKTNTTHLPGDLVAVRTGMSICIDGVVEQGSAMVNQATLTGEPLAVERSVGDDVFAGTVVEDGSILVRVRANTAQTKLRSIVSLVQTADSLKSEGQSHMEDLANKIVPWNFLLAGLVALTTRSLIKTSAALMVDYSCALKLTGSVAVMTAMSDAAKMGVMVKGAKYFESFAKADTIVFDKTGTLTRATPQVVQVVPFSGCEEQEVLQLAACLEEHFPHSMANAVVRAAKERGISHEEMHSEVEYIVAHGIASRVGGTRVVIGSAHFIFEDEGCTIPAGEQAKFDALDPQYSHLYLAASGVLAGVICIADPLRPEAAQVLHKLRRLGITQTVMMTGDSDRTARAIAAQVGVDRCFAEVLPEDKAAFVRDAKAEGHTVVMIGDGINDSPALSAADIGIAIHSGAAIAREIADVTIRADSLEELVTLKAIANALQKRVGSNYRFVLSFNSALILLGALGILPPATSAMLHNLSTLGISLRSMTDLLEQKNEG